MSKSNFPNFPSSSNNRPLYFKADFPQFSSGLFNMKGGDVSNDAAFLDTTIGDYINKNITELFIKDKKYRLIPAEHLKSTENYMEMICKKIIELSDDVVAQKAYIQRKYSAHSIKKAHKIIKDKKVAQSRTGVLKAFIIPIMANFMKQIKKDVNKFNKKKQVEEDAADDKFTFDINADLDFLDEEYDSRLTPPTTSSTPLPQYSMLPAPMLHIPRTKPKGNRLGKPMPPPVPRRAALPVPPPQHEMRRGDLKKNLEDLLLKVAEKKIIQLEQLPPEGQMMYLKGAIRNIIGESFTDNDTFNYNNYIQSINNGIKTYQNKLATLEWTENDPKRLLYSILLDFLSTVVLLKEDEIPRSILIGGGRKKRRNRKRITKRKRRNRKRMTKRKNKRKTKRKRRKKRRTKKRKY